MWWKRKKENIENKKKLMKTKWINEWSEME